MLVTAARSDEAVFTRTSGNMRNGAGDERIVKILLTTGGVDPRPAAGGIFTIVWWSGDHKILE